MNMFGPDPDGIYPNESIKSVCFIKNVITSSNIHVGAYTYYDDPDDATGFEKHVTHHYEFLGDKLIIGKFCAIAKGVEFVMNGANHRMQSATTLSVQYYGRRLRKEHAGTGGFALQGRYGDWQ